MYVPCHPPHGAYVHLARRKKRGKSRRGRRRSVVTIEEVPTPPQLLPTVRIDFTSVLFAHLCYKIEEHDEVRPGSKVESPPTISHIREASPSTAPKTTVEDDLNCTVAHTSLIVPCTIGNHRMPPGYWEEHLLERTILDTTGT